MFSAALAPFSHKTPPPAFLTPRAPAGNVALFCNAESDTTRGDHQAPPTHTAASLLLPMDGDTTSGRQYPPLPPADKLRSNTAQASVGTRPWAGAAGSGSVQGAGSAARGRRWSSESGEESAARAREERGLLSLPLYTSVGSPPGLDPSMDCISEEDPKTMDT